MWSTIFLTPQRAGSCEARHVHRKAEQASTACKAGSHADSHAARQSGSQAGKLRSQPRRQPATQTARQATQPAKQPATQPASHADKHRPVRTRRKPLRRGCHSIRLKRRSLASAQTKLGGMIPGDKQASTQPRARERERERSSLRCEAYRLGSTARSGGLKLHQTEGLV